MFPGEPCFRIEPNHDDLYPKCQKYATASNVLDGMQLVSQVMPEHATSSEISTSILTVTIWTGRTGSSASGVGRRLNGGRV